MADNEEDLVGNVKIDGLDTATEGLDKFGKSGKEAFEKIGDAADKSSKQIGDATDKISKGLEDVAKSADEVQNSSSSLSSFGEAAVDVGGAVGSAVENVLRFSASVIGVAVAVKGAILGVAKFASATTSAYRGLAGAQSDQAKQQQKMNAQQVSGIATSDNYNNSLEDLRIKLGKGELNYQSYAKAVEELNRTYDRQVATTRRVQAAQLELIEKNEKIAQIKARNEAYDALVKTYGGPLTNSLISLGGTYDSVKKKATEAFSPALARIVDSISNLFTKNAANIDKFITVASTKLDDLIVRLGPTFTKLIGYVDSFSKGAILAISNFVIPRFEQLIDILDKVALAINNTFGTKFDGPMLAGAAAILYLTGGFKLLTNAVYIGATAVKAFQAAVAFGPIGIAILAVAAAVGVLVAAWLLLDWGAIGKAGGDAADSILVKWNSVKAWFAAFWPNLKLIFSTGWAYLKAGWDAAGNAVLAAFGAVGDFFVTLGKKIVEDFGLTWQLLVDGWTASKDAVIAAYTGVRDFFTGLPQTIVDVFTQLWTTIKDGFKSAFDNVSTTLKGWVESTMKFLKPLLDMLKTIASIGGGDGTSSGDATKVSAFARGGKVRGPGTSTSDSIAAWLSNNEFVVRAKAVKKYGTGLLSAINSGQLDVGKMMAFAGGGLVSMPSMPSYGGGGRALASAGSSAARTPLNLTIGDQQYNGLLAPDEVASRLVQHANAKRVTSAGRPPGWKG